MSGAAQLKRSCDAHQAEPSERHRRSKEIADRDTVHGPGIAATAPRRSPPGSIPARSTRCRRRETESRAACKAMMIEVTGPRRHAHGQSKARHRDNCRRGNAARSVQRGSARARRSCRPPPPQRRAPPCDRTPGTGRRQDGRPVRQRRASPGGDQDATDGTDATTLIAARPANPTRLTIT